MKREFKVGDSVSYYFIDSTENAAYGSGNIRRIQDGKINVNGRWLHPKQCRRLVKKKRREFWLAKRPTPFDGWAAYEDIPPPGVKASAIEIIHVVEVRK